MKVATNMLFSEEANLIIYAKRLGLNLIGIVCPFIELPPLKHILENNSSNDIRIITSKGTIGKWYKQFKAGKTPGKKGDHPTKDQSLDWIKKLNSIGENSHILITKTNKRKIKVYVNVEKDIYIHTKLYVFDKGFVITSGNITDFGTLMRHLEMGVLVTEKDNKLEVEIVKRWFENRWNHIERSCLALRVEKTMDFAKKIIEKALEKEIQENQKKQENSEFYFSNRLFCFGCDEGRNGKIITKKVKIDGGNYEEIICDGCDQILNKIRKFLPTMAQEISHEGRLVWRISKKYYDFKYTHLYHYEKYDKDDFTISFDVTDNGSIDKLIRALVASKIESGYVCLNCGDALKPDFKICPSCGTSVKINIFGI